MVYFLLALALVLLVFGVIFSVIPPLPGPILSYIGLLVVHFSDADASFSTFGLIFWTVMVIAITVADYILPIMATKKFGGTKAGVWGGVIGALAGFILPIPFGVIIGPLVGAIVGDLIGGNHYKAAMRSGFGSFIGFLIATGLKVFVAFGIGIAVVLKIGQYAWQLFS